MSGGSGGSGFAIRITILLAFLATCVGIWAYDSQVRGPQIQKEIEGFYNLMTLETDDGHGIPKDMVHEKTGVKPLATYVEGQYEVEHYRISRTLPFMPGGAELYAVYDGKALKAIETKRMNEEELKAKYALKLNLNDWTGDGPRPNLPAASVPGGGGGGGNQADDDEGQKDDEAEKKDGDGEAKSDDGKADGGTGKSEGDGAKGDGTEGDGAKGDGAKGDGAKGDGAKGDGAGDGQ